MTTIGKFLKQPIIVAHPARREFSPLLPDITLHGMGQGVLKFGITFQRSYDAGNSWLVEMQQRHAQ